ncbi:unnamed protein product, partial [Lymnaea stagnalis]
MLKDDCDVSTNRRDVDDTESVSSASSGVSDQTLSPGHSAPVRSGQRGRALSVNADHGSKQTPAAREVTPMVESLGKATFDSGEVGPFTGVKSTSTSTASPERVAHVVGDPAGIGTSGEDNRGQGQSESAWSAKSNSYDYLKCSASSTEPSVGGSFPSFQPGADARSKRNLSPDETSPADRDEEEKRQFLHRAFLSAGTSPTSGSPIREHPLHPHELSPLNLRLHPHPYLGHDLSSQMSYFRRGCEPSKDNP